MEKDGNLIKKHRKTGKLVLVYHNISCWKLQLYEAQLTMTMPEVYWRQNPNIKQYGAGDWAIWSWPASLQQIVFFLSKYFFACVRIWRHIASFNSELELYSYILMARSCKYVKS